MRAVTIPEFGGPDVLTVADRPEPELGPGRVAIDVTHAGINYAEVLFRRGTVRVDLPYVPGIEVAGRVRAVGAGVTGLEPGTPVAALTMVDGGGYAEVAVTDARLVAPLSAEPTAVDAATPSNTTTAFLALETVARMAEGDSVLVHAAAGGLGSQVGQVAKLLGAGRVVGTVGSPAKRDRALELGYDEVVLRSEVDGLAAEFDLVVDPVGGPVRSRSLQLLRLGGRVLAVGNASDADDVTLGANELWFASTGVLGHNTGAWAAGRPDDVGQALRRAVEAVADGSVRVDLTATVPMDKVGAAHLDLEQGATTGKAVLDIAG